MSERRSVTLNIRQRLNSGSYNVTRNYRKNERDLTSKIAEYEQQGNGMSNVKKVRLAQAKEALAILRSKKAANNAARALGAAGPSANNMAGLGAPRPSADNMAGLGAPAKAKKRGLSVVVERPKPTEKTLDELFNRWIPWEKYPDCKDIPFKSSVKGIGNGEHKLAVILGTEPNGQNKLYDLDICLKIKGVDVCSMGEVKEIEKDSSFFPGANGRNEFRKTKHLIANLQEIFNTLFNEYKDMLSAKIIDHMSCYKEKKDGSVAKNDLLTMTPDEISQTNLPRLIETCEYLNLQRQIIVSSNNYKQQFKIHDTLSGEARHVNSSRLYKILSADSKSPAEISSILGAQVYKLEKFLELTEHPFITNTSEFIEYLNNFADKLFKKYTLILVNKDKGFYITSELNKHIKIYRITRAYPKFLISMSGNWDDVIVKEEEEDNEEPPEDS